MLHVIGKITTDKSWNMIKTDRLFEIDGHAADSARKRNMAQDAIYSLIKDNKGIKHFEIGDRLYKTHLNDNRVLKTQKGWLYYRISSGGLPHI